jgi:hypothetical protein
VPDAARVMLLTSVQVHTCPQVSTHLPRRSTPIVLSSSLHVGLLLSPHCARLRLVARRPTAATKPW